MTQFIEVTDPKTNDKLLINTMMIIEIKDQQITVMDGHYKTKYKTVESYDDLRRKLTVT